MYKEFMIGSIPVSMRADGATPYRFRQVWGMDLIRFFSEKKDLTDQEAAETLMKLGYVMNMQARRATEEDYDKASAAGMAGYLNWLGQFDPIPAQNAWADVLRLYTAGAQTESVKKNEIGQSTES